MQEGKFKEAFSAFKEAVKYKRDSWQLWSNYAAAALKTGSFQAAARAVEQVKHFARHIADAVINMAFAYLSKLASLLFLIAQAQLLKLKKSQGCPALKVQLFPRKSACSIDQTDGMLFLQREVILAWHLI